MFIHVSFALHKTTDHHRDRTMPHDLENVEIIDLYSRQDAIADGQQINITERYAGYTRRFQFVYPMLMTRSVWNDLMEDLDEADRKQAIWLILAGLSRAIANTSGRFISPSVAALPSRIPSSGSNPITTSSPGVDRSPQTRFLRGLCSPRSRSIPASASRHLSATPSSKKYIHR